LRFPGGRWRGPGEQSAKRSEATHQQYILAKAAEGFAGPRWTDAGCAAFDLGMTDAVWEEAQWDEVAARELFDGEYRKACAVARARAARKGIASVIA
jgi:hypothetical protein